MSFRKNYGRWQIYLESSTTLIFIATILILFLFFLDVKNEIKKNRELKNKNCVSCELNRKKLNQILKAYDFDHDPKNAKVEDENGSVYHPVRPMLPHEVSSSFLDALEAAGGEELAAKMRKEARDFLKPY